MKKDYIVFLVMFLVSSVLIQLIIVANLIYAEQNNNLMKAEASGGMTRICFNFPPTINLSNCPLQINQSTRIENNSMTCNITTGHPRNHSVIIADQTVNGSGFFFELTRNGTITLEGNHTGIGTRTFTITAYDDYACPFTTNEPYTVQILDINDPPHLIDELDDQRLNENTEKIAFFLDNYFGDVDGDLLTYRVLQPSAALNVNITIYDNSMVVIRSPANNCKTDHVLFEAKDPGNLTEVSNVVKIESICPREEPPPQLGGGGGLTETCEENWKCDEWSECFINGTQYKDCIDQHRCNLNEYEKKFWRECEYIATCSDKIQNCHILPDGTILCEEGIDCGGPCEECQLDEEDKETPPATCTDGIQNCHTQANGTIICEEGIDCGGPCEECRRIETPGLIVDETANNIILYTAIAVVLTAALLATYIAFRKQILTAFAKLSWWLTRRKRKQILLKDDIKKQLLQETNKLYTTIYNSDNNEFTIKDKPLINTILLTRTYVATALKIVEEFSFEEVQQNLKRIINKSLRQGFQLYTESIFPKEKKNSKITKQELLNFLQETRMLIINTSKITKEDFNFRAIEQDITGNELDKAQALIHNTYLALCFAEVLSAKNNYFELLKIYEKMNNEEKTKTYYELTKIYNYVKTILSWI